MADFADDIIEELLERTAKGEQLTKLTEDVRMPSRSSVYSWIESDKEFAGRFRAARARGVHALAEECLVIADEKVDKDDNVAVSNKRVRIDTRLRLAGKWLSSEYGDKLDISNKTEVTHRHDLSGYSSDELDTLEKLIAKAPNASGDQVGESPPQPDRLH